MDSVWLALICGAAAFPHCLGMCGGFALHLACAEPRGKAGAPGRVATLARQLLWHSGRTVSYVFLGALAGWFGFQALSPSRWPWARGLAGYLVGAAMILLGLALLGALPFSRREIPPGGEEGLFSAVARRFFFQPTALGALALGLANGFLPCPVTVACLALAAQTRSVAWGMTIMAAMGLGTVWALLLLGITGRMIGLKWRRWGAVVLGILLIALGGWTVLRKAGVLPPLPGISSPSPISQEPDCCR